MFDQSKLARATEQAQDIFNKYVYETSDTCAEVQTDGYFLQSRFAQIDAPDTNGNGLAHGIIEARCSDGYMIGMIDGQTGTLSGQFLAPSIVTQVDFINSEDTSDQIPSGIGVARQITFGAAQTSDEFTLGADGTITCLIAGQYRFVFTAQAGRLGAAGTVNLFMRLLRNGTQAGSSVVSILDDAQTVVPLRFNLTIDLSASDILTAEVIQDTSGISGSRGLYSIPSEAAGWGVSPSASVLISQLRLVA